MISMVLVVYKFLRVRRSVRKVESFFMLSWNSSGNRSCFGSLWQRTFFGIFFVRRCSLTTDRMSSQYIVMCGKRHSFIYRPCLCLAYFCCTLVNKLLSESLKWKFSFRKNRCDSRFNVLTRSTIEVTDFRLIDLLSKKLSTP